MFIANDATHGYELWRTDGTESGTLLVKNVSPQSNYNYSNHIHDLVELNGIVYFDAYDGINGTELWRSDGTDAGTWMVSDIRPGASSGNIKLLTIYNDLLIFQANDGINGAELWRSDGTAAGTFVVKDIYPGTAGSTPGSFKEHQGLLYFTARDDVHGYELWRTDGTESGTWMVIDIRAWFT